MRLSLGSTSDPETMKAIDSLSRFLVSQVGLLVLGFVLTTLAGGALGYWFNLLASKRNAKFEACRQQLQWQRDKNFEILRRTLDEGEHSLEQISDLINLRVFRLRKVREDPTSPVAWSEYLSAVEQWNVKLIINQNKLERLVGKQVALEFNNYETDAPVANPVSLHGKFFAAHNALLSLRTCVQAQCTEIVSRKTRADSLLRTLDYATDGFVDRVSKIFLQQTVDLQSFATDSGILACAA